MVCTLFGHGKCPGLDRTVLQNAMEELIQKGVDTFYVGTQGEFDRMALACLRELAKRRGLKILNLSAFEI